MATLRVISEENSKSQAEINEELFRFQAELKSELSRAKMKLDVILTMVMENRKSTSRDPPQTTQTDGILFTPPFKQDECESELIKAESQPVKDESEALFEQDYCEIELPMVSMDLHLDNTIGDVQPVKEQQTEESGCSVLGKMIVHNGAHNVSDKISESILHKIDVYDLGIGANKDQLDINEGQMNVTYIRATLLEKQVIDLYAYKLKLIKLILFDPGGGRNVVVSFSRRDAYSLTGKSPKMYVLGLGVTSSHRLANSFINTWEMLCLNKLIYTVHEKCDNIYSLNDMLKFVFDPGGWFLIRKDCDILVCNREQEDFHFNTIFVVSPEYYYYVFDGDSAKSTSILELSVGIRISVLERAAFDERLCEHKQAFIILRNSQQALLHVDKYNLVVTAVVHLFVFFHPRDVITTSMNIFIGWKVAHEEVEGVFTAVSFYSVQNMDMINTSASSLALWDSKIYVIPAGLSTQRVPLDLAESALLPLVSTVLIEFTLLGSNSLGYQQRVTYKNSKPLDGFKQCWARRCGDTKHLDVALINKIGVPFVTSVVHFNEMSWVTKYHSNVFDPGTRANVTKQIANGVHMNLQCIGSVFVEIFAHSDTSLPFDHGECYLPLIICGVYVCIADWRVTKDCMPQMQALIEHLSWVKEALNQDDVGLPSAIKFSLEMLINGTKIVGIIWHRKLHGHKLVVLAGATVLNNFVWDPGQDVIFFYIIEDNDVLKRKGIRIQLALALKQGEKLNGASAHMGLLECSLVELSLCTMLLVTSSKFRIKKLYSLMELFLRSVGCDSIDPNDAKQRKNVNNGKRLEVTHLLSDKLPQEISVELNKEVYTIHVNAECWHIISLNGVISCVDKLQPEEHLLNKYKMFWRYVNLTDLLPWSSVASLIQSIVCHALEDMNRVVKFLNESEHKDILIILLAGPCNAAWRLCTLMQLNICGDVLDALNLRKLKTLEDAYEGYQKAKQRCVVVQTDHITVQDWLHTYCLSIELYHVPFTPFVHTHSSCLVECSKDAVTEITPLYFDGAWLVVRNGNFGIPWSLPNCSKATFFLLVLSCRFDHVVLQMARMLCLMGYNGYYYVLGSYNTIALESACSMNPCPTIHVVHTNILRGAALLKSFISDPEFYHFTTLRTRWLLRGRTCHDPRFKSDKYGYYMLPTCHM